LSAKIIDSRRYKTITKTQLNKKRKKEDAAIKSQKKSYQKSIKKSTNDSNSSFISNLRIKRHRERKLEREMLLYSRPERTVIKEPKQKMYIPKSFVISCCVIAAIVLIYISGKIMKVDEMIAVNVFNNNEQNEEVKVNLKQNYDLRIGLTSFENTNSYTSTNLILNDLYKQTSLKLIEVKNNYSITYQVARSIKKLSDTEYLIELNDNYKLDLDDIKYSIDNIKNAGQDSMYYDRIDNVSSIEQGENKNSIKITLKSKNPYFIYYLDFPLLDDESKINGKFTYTSNEESAIFKRANKNENKNLNSITLTNYNSIDDVVDAFINNETDIFFATSNNDMQLIGKNEYNVKKYKDGETLFIFGNKESSIFSKKEIRTALMYSLNRDEIVKNSDNNFIEVIDLPFLYSTIRYKYDIVGSNNLMTSNGWNKNGYGIYHKYENGNEYTATLKLLVNGDDESKVNVANNIKNMALNAGIDIQIDAVSKADVSVKVNAKDYDIVLASVYLDETPNVEFLRKYLDINSNTTQAFTQVEESSVEDIEKNIQNLQFILSDEVACIGIYARNINLVYQKGIYGFEDINYMNIFSNIDNIGKIIE